MIHPRARSLAAVFALACAGCGDAGAGPPRADVVVVVVDTLRADYADPESGRADLPNLRQFARDATRFSAAFSPAPMTLPAHAALFSGQVPAAAGVTTNGQGVALELPLLSDWLRQHGYSSQAAVSLATLWPLGRGQGLDRGFERFDRGTGSITAADDTNRELSPMLAELALRRPFFLFAHYAEPHEPYEAHGRESTQARIEWNGSALETATISEWAQLQRPVELQPGENRLAIRSDVLFKVRTLELVAGGAPLDVRFEAGALLLEQKELIAVVDNPAAGKVLGLLELWLHDAPAVADLPARYRVEAEAADRAFGELVAMLKKRGLYEDSLIVFTSDHGEALGEHDIVGHVVNLHDEMLHVPLYVKLPRGHAGARKLARSQRGLARLIDVTPTILDALDLPALPGQEGVSLLQEHERVLLAQTFAPEAPRTLFALRDERTKLVYDVAADSFTMYDLATDPGELVDIFPKSGAQRLEWQKGLRELKSLRSLTPAGAPASDPAVLERLKALGY